MLFATFTRPAAALLLSAAAVGLLAGCAGRDAAPAAPPQAQARAQGPGAANAATSADSLAQTSWELVRWTRADGSPYALPSGNDRGPVHLTFLAHGRQYRVEGFAGCNRYRGTYLLRDGALTIQAPAATRATCGQPERAAFEAAYLQALGQIDTFTLDNGGAPRRLTFTLRSGDVLDFVRRTDPPTP